MADVATIVKFSDSKKSALISVKKNAFQLNGTIGYISAEPLKGKKKGDSFDLPSGWRVEHRADAETGEVMTTKEGQPLSFLTWTPLPQ